MDRLIRTTRDKLDEVVRTRLDKHITENESVYLCYEWLKGSPPKATEVYVLTETQLIKVSSDKVAHWSVFPLSEVTSIEQETHSLPYRVHVNGSLFKFDSERETTHFVFILKTLVQVAEMYRPFPNIQSPDADERLRKLDQLHQEGLITDDEFQQRREELLRQ